MRTPVIPRPVRRLVVGIRLFSRGNGLPHPLRGFAMTEDGHLQQARLSSPWTVPTDFCGLVKQGEPFSTIQVETCQHSFLIFTQVSVIVFSRSLCDVERAPPVAAEGTSPPVAVLCFMCSFVICISGRFSLAFVHSFNIKSCYLLPPCLVLHF